MISDLAKYKLALDSASNHIIITDTDGKVLYANKSVERLTGYSREEIMGQTPRLWGKQMSPEFYQQMWKTIKEDKRVFEGELINKRKSGELYTAKTTISPIIDEATGGLVGFIAVEEDITARKRSESEILSLNKAMVGRELKMVELKARIAQLEGQLGMKA